MKKIFLSMMCAFLATSISAQEEGTLVIYRFQVDGVTTYAHILPRGVKDYVKLDAEGFEIEALPELNNGAKKQDGQALKDDVLRPEDEEGLKKSSDEETSKKEAGEDKKKTEDDKKEEEKKKLTEEEKALSTLNKRNCEIAQQDMKTLQGKQVFDMTPEGVKILEGEDLEKRRKKTQKDVDYFCSE